VVVVLAIAFSSPGAAVSPEAAGVPAPAYVAPEKCRSARAGVAHYRALTWQRQDARGGERADRTPVARGRSCHWARYVVGVWAARAHDARIALEKWRYLFDWRSWLPRNWYELGSCETGYGGDPNSYQFRGSHDRQSNR